MQNMRCRDAIGKWDFGVGQVWVMILKEPSASSVFILSEKADYVSAGDCYSGITDTQSPKDEFRCLPFTNSLLCVNTGRSSSLHTSSVSWRKKNHFFFLDRHHRFGGGVPVPEGGDHHEGLQSRECSLSAGDLPAARGFSTRGPALHEAR